MGIAHLIAVLVVIGVLLWAVNYLFAKYINADILELINKLAVVLVVLYVVFWVLAWFGIVPGPPPDLWWGARPGH